MVSTRYWEEYHARILAQEQELIRMAFESLYRAGLEDIRVSAAYASRSICEQVCSRLFNQMSEAEALLSQLESRDPALITSWSLRVARDRLDTVRTLWQDSTTQLTKASERYETALAQQARRNTPIAEVIQRITDALRERAQEYATAVVEELHNELNKPKEPTKEELQEIRRKIRQDDWSDLPPYQGADAPSDRDCLHCGTALPLDRKRFCSKRCHRIFAEVYGSTARPRSRNTG